MKFLYISNFQNFLNKKIMENSKLFHKESIKYFFLIVFIIISLSCSSKKQNEELTTKDLAPERIKNDMFIDSLNSFDELFYLKKKISLETVSQALLGKPWDMIVSNDKIIINDLMSTGTIHIFSIEGNYIGQLGNKGEGPGEYKSPEKMVIINDEIFVYDPILLKINVYNLNKLNYLRSWKVKNFFESMISINNNIVVLNKIGMGYESDFEIFDTNGNKIKSGNFAKSNSEKKRRYMFGGSFRLSSIDDKLLYIGADEYKIICYDIKLNKHLWISQEIPTELKVPNDLPVNVRELGIKWMKENYSSLINFFVLNNSMINILADDFFIIYDKYGKFRKTFKNPNPNNYFTTDNKYLYSVSIENINKTNELLNPEIFVYEIKN